MGDSSGGNGKSLEIYQLNHLSFREVGNAMLQRPVHNKGGSIALFTVPSIGIMLSAEKTVEIREICIAVATAVEKSKRHVGSNGRNMKCSGWKIQACKFIYNWIDLNLLFIILTQFELKQLLL